MSNKILKNRHAVLAVYVILFVSVLVCGLYVYSVHATLQGNFREDVETALLRKSESIDKDLQAGYRMLKERSSFIQNNQIKSEAWSNYLKSFSDPETYERISIIDLSGNAISSDGFSYNAANERYFQDSLTGKDSISDIFIDPTRQEEVFVLGTPLKKGDEIIAVLAMTKRADFLKKEFTDNFYNGEIDWLIVDKRGSIIVDSKHHHDEHKYQNLIEELQRTPQNKNKTENFIDMITDKQKIDGNNVTKVMISDKNAYLGLVKMNAGGENWRLISMIDEDVVLKKSQTLVGDAFLMCLAVMIVLGIMAIYIAYMRENNRRDVEKLAYVDSLTQINNFNAFQLKAASLLSKNLAVDYAIVCVDVKNFKYVNEIYGYAEGDRILLMFAQKLKACFQRDETCARVSGDKFVVLYKKDNDDFMRMHQILEEFINEQNNYLVKIPIVFTVGIYQVPYESRRKIKLVDLTMQPYQFYSHCENIVSMVDKANLARTAIKNSGAITICCYDDSLMKQFVEENEIVALMGNALTNREFVVYLQPKYDLKSLQVVGAEALVRWISKEKGFMNPDMFIGIFEKNGFIIELDFYILEEVCKKIRYWLDNGIEPVPISVNQSRTHMNNPLYISRLSSLLKRYGIPAKFIELELTETMFFDNTRRLVDIIGEMRSLGLSISMDDFGSGYSSLNLLKELPVDTLKLDKTFLYETENSARSKIIIEQVVEMARKLGMITICEGVEMEEQADFLREIDCDIAQGFLYAKPMPMEEFDQFREKPLL